MKELHDLVIYQSSHGNIQLQVEVANDTVWLTQDQMTALFGRDQSVISRHISRIFREHELDKESNMHFLHIANSDRPAIQYSLDVVISVGYRVKSLQGTEFRVWANAILKQYLIQGYVANRERLQQLGTAVQVMKRTLDKLDSNQILDIVGAYSRALDLLDEYDHGMIQKPSGTESAYIIKYEECKNIIDRMTADAKSSIFGIEKDDSFKSSLAAIYQTVSGVEVYPSLEEKAGNLLYFIIKNHSFVDGNKRIAAAVFLFFLDQNHALFFGKEKRLDEHTLVALVIMIAESHPHEKDAMVKLVMNFLIE